MDKKQPVKINLRGTVGVRGQYYGPGEGIEVPYDVAESIALSQGKSVDELTAVAKSAPKAEPAKEVAPAVASAKPKTETKGVEK